MPVRIAIGLSITVIALVVAGRRFHWVSRLIRSGRADPKRTRGSLFRKAEAEVTEVAGQRKLLRWTIPGTAHFFTMWGFTILLFTIVEAYGCLFQRDFHFPGIGHTAVLGFLEDFFIVAVLLALITFTVIRLINAPRRRERTSRFYGSHTGAAWLVLAMIAGVMITLLMYRGAQVNTGNFPYGWWAFASHIVGQALHPLGTGVNSVLEATFLLLNIAVIVGFLVFVSYSKHLHIFIAPINVAFSRRPRALGALYSTPDMDMENVTEDTVFGVGQIEHFSWKQMLDFATCTECGRCQSVCPAWTTGKPLSPKLVIMGLRDNMFSSAGRLLASPGGSDGSGESTNGSSSASAGSEPESLVPMVIDPDVLWSCTTCGSCVEQCPVDIEHVDSIVDMRRYEVLMESRFPTEAGLMLRNIENQGDPWGLGQSKRTESTEVLDFEVPIVTDSIPDDVEYLFWVGCAGALDERARKATQAIARMLHQAGVTFAILGPKESCTSNPPSPGQRVPLPRAGQGQRGHAERGGGPQGSGLVPALLQFHQERVPGPGRGLRGHPPHPTARAPGLERPADPPGPPAHRHLPRSLLPRPPQPGLRRATLGAGRHPRRPAGGDAPVPGARLLLRCGWGPHVDGGEHRQAGQHGAHRGGPGHRGRRRLHGVPLLHDHARRRGAGQRQGGRGEGARPLPGGGGVPQLLSMPQARSGHRCSRMRPEAATGESSAPASGTTHVLPVPLGTVT